MFSIWIWTAAYPLSITGCAPCPDNNHRSDFVGWARFWGLLPKTCISEKTSWSGKISHFVIPAGLLSRNPAPWLSSRINKHFLQRRWTPAQKPCRGDGYGNLSAGQKLSGMVFTVTTIAYGAHGQKVYLGNSTFWRAHPTLSQLLLQINRTAVIEDWNCRRSDRHLY